MTLQAVHTPLFLKHFKTWHTSYSTPAGFSLLSAPNKWVLQPREQLLIFLCLEKQYRPEHILTVLSMSLLITSYFRDMTSLCLRIS